MKIKTKIHSIELTRQELNIIEEELFNATVHYANLIGAKSIEKFKEDLPNLYRLYEMIQQKSVSQ